MATLYPLSASCRDQSPGQLVPTIRLQLDTLKHVSPAIAGRSGLRQSPFRSMTFAPAGRSASRRGFVA